MWKPLGDSYVKMRSWRWDTHNGKVVSFKEENRIALSLSQSFSLPSVSSFSLLSLSPFPFAPTHPHNVTQWGDWAASQQEHLHQGTKSAGNLNFPTSRTEEMNVLSLTHPVRGVCLWQSELQLHATGWTHFLEPSRPNCDISWIYFPEKWTIWGTAVSLKGLLWSITAVDCLKWCT